MRLKVRADKTKNSLQLRQSLRLGRNGFTLAELLVALTVTGIILGAVATLAYALGRTSDITDELGRNQAYVRYATTRLSQLIRYSKLVCYIPPGGDSLVLWRADEDVDNEIDPNELVYIETGTDCNHIALLEFDDPVTTRTIGIGEIQDGSVKTWLFANCNYSRYVHLVPQCANPMFAPDESPPPYTGLVNISFEVAEDGVMQTYQITAVLRGRAVNLLDSAGEIVTGDDD